MLLALLALSLAWHVDVALAGSPAPFPAGYTCFPGVDIAGRSCDLQRVAGHLSLAKLAADCNARRASLPAD